MNNHFVLFQYPFGRLACRWMCNSPRTECARRLTPTPGDVVLTKGVGRHQKKIAVLKQLKLKVKRETWKGVGTPFPCVPRPTTPCLHPYACDVNKPKTCAHICNVCEFLGTNYCMHKWWPIGTLQQSFHPLTQTSIYWKLVVLCFKALLRWLQHGISAKNRNTCLLGFYFIYNTALKIA